jgi:hypothetical protein
LSALKSITLPDTVKVIGTEAFKYDYSLYTIKIPSDVTTIGSSAFGQCYSLIEVYNLSGLTIKAEDYNNGQVAYYAKNVYGTSGDTNIRIVDDFAFYDDGTNVYLLGYVGSDSEITLPTSAKVGSNYKIYQYAFYGNTSLTNVVISEGVTAIGSYAFYNCSKLTSLSLPNSLQSIDSQALYGCSSLTYTESGNAKYLGNSENSYLVLVSATSPSITSCGINSATKIIYYQAFYSCSKLDSISIPENIISIGGEAFRGCSNLFEVQNKSELNITKGSTDNGYVAYYALRVYGANEKSSIATDSNGYKYIVDGDSVTLIAYTGTETTITLPTTLAGKTYSIYAGIFSGNTTLISVTIPSASEVSAIPNNAFYGCTSLTTVSLPSTLTSIGENAFYGCSALTSITIPENVKTIGSSAFYNCKGLTEINLNATVNDLSSYNNIFYNAGSSASGITLNISANVTKIANYLFNPSNSYSYAPKITSVIFADNSQCEEIGDYAFYYLDKVTTLVLPDSLTKLGYRAIYSVDKLETLVVGKDIALDNDYYFCYYSGKLKVVYFHGAADELSASKVNSYSNFNDATKLYYSETEATGAWHYVNDVPTAW